MLTWLDNRNNTVFDHIAWDDITKTLTFSITTNAHNLQVMVPVNSADGELIQIIENGTPITYSVQTIKGIQYGFFAAGSRNYIAVYSKKSR